MDAALPLKRPYPALYPLRLRPALHRRVWGGERLTALFDGAVDAPSGPAGEPLGEAWLAGDASVVADGPLAGRTVAELAAAYGEALVGVGPSSKYGARMPLLAKLLDAGDDLSVQVHPDDAYAAEHEAESGYLGKSEAWYVIEAKVGAGALWGFKEALTADELRSAARDGTLPSLMRRVPLAPGDLLANPPGTVHAALAGLFFYEIQQSSDITYRLYDYGRVGADGKPRELHLGRGAEVADLSGAEPSRYEPVQLGGGWERLLDSPEFVLDRGRATGAAELALEADPESLRLLTVLAGEFSLAGADGHAAWAPVLLRQFETVLLPASLGAALTVAGAGELLCASAGSARVGAAPTQRAGRP